MPKNKKTGFHVQFISGPQKMAWAFFQENDILFLRGMAGTGKTYMAMSFAINEVLQGSKKKIILTRPIVEAGEKLGFLPGDFGEKVNPYMMPLYDAMDKLLGYTGPQRELIEKSVEVAPIAYLRGRTFDNAVAILDEAQNCTKMQLKLFLTRLGANSKLVVTGDPTQSDVPDSGFVEVMDKLQSLTGVAMVSFEKESSARHPLVAEIAQLI